MASFCLWGGDRLVRWVFWAGTWPQTVEAGAVARPSLAVVGAVVAVQREEAAHPWTVVIEGAEEEAAAEEEAVVVAAAAVQ